MTEQEHIVRYTAEELTEKRRNGESLSDWERVRNMTEEELEASIDYAEEGNIDWDTIYEGFPPVAVKKQITLRLDPEIIDFFRQQGPGYQTRMNQVLRSYVEAQGEKAGLDRSDRKAS
jgi:uncharacterized protein (DUF4415 family)